MGGGQYANLRNGIKYVIFTPDFDRYKGCNVLHNGEDTDLQANIKMTEIQDNDLGYVYSLYSGTSSSPDYFQLRDDNWIWRTIYYYTGGSPFVNAQFIVHFQFDSNLDTIIDNSCITKGDGYYLETLPGNIYKIMNNQTLYPSFIEDTYFEPEEERYILILTV